MTKFFIYVMHLKQIELAINLDFYLFTRFFQPFEANSSTFGVKRNTYSNMVQSQVLLDDLFIAI